MIIKSYPTGQKSLYIDPRHNPEQVGNCRILRIIRVINRFNSKPNKIEPLTITHGLLINIISVQDANDPCDANHCNTFCIAYAGYLWEGEITWNANDPNHGYKESAEWNLTL
jgi:hypothetical protein